MPYRHDLTEECDHGGSVVRYPKGQACPLCHLTLSHDNLSEAYDDLKQWVYLTTGTLPWDPIGKVLNATPQRHKYPYYPRVKRNG